MFVSHAADHGLLTIPAPCYPELPFPVPRTGGCWKSVTCPFHGRSAQLASSAYGHCASSGCFARTSSQHHLSSVRFGDNPIEQFPFLFWCARRVTRYQCHSHASIRQNLGLAHIPLFGSSSPDSHSGHPLSDNRMSRTDDTISIDAVTRSRRISGGSPLCSSSP